MEYRRPSLIGPLILITIGVLFLLSNMGMLPFTFWEVAVRFWPLLLILVGLDIMIGRRSTVGGLLILVLWVALIGGLIWLASTQGAGFLPGTAAVSEPLSQPLGDIKSASVALNFGVADTVVNSLGSDSGDLMNGTFRHPEGTRVVKTYQVVGDEGRLALREEGFNFFLPTAGFSRWEVGLNPAVPLALIVNGGVGRSVLDLSGLRVTMLSIDSGVGSIDVTAPRAGFVTMRLNGGVGSARVVIPPGMPARIRVDAGLGGISVDQARFPRFGDVYQSADYASATDKIDVDIDGGVGGISIQ
jgi:hypothetical protein